MTLNLTTRKENKLQLNGNLVTGETFPVKDYLKSYCEAKWNKDAKGWNVNLDKFMALVTGNNSIGLKVDETPAPAKHNVSDNGFCHKCQSWCYGDCES